MEGFARNAEYLITLRPDSNEYRRMAQRFGVEAGRQPAAEIPAPKKLETPGPRRIDDHGRTVDSLD